MSDNGATEDSAAEGPTSVQLLQQQPLSRLVHLQAMLERGRISADNQRRDLKDSPTAALYAEISSALHQLEDRIEGAMHAEVQTHPTWGWLEGVKGIGPQAASLLFAFLLPPIPGKGPSSWYKAAGLYAIRVDCKKCKGLGYIETDTDEPPLVEGDVQVAAKARAVCVTCHGEGGQSRLPRYDHLDKGQTAYWHPRLRRNLYVVGTCLMRANGVYKKWYDEMKAALELKHPDWKGRVHAVAFWKMVKLFLSHLWEVWSEEINVETRGPYPMEILGHVKIEVPREGG